MAAYSGMSVINYSYDDKVEGKYYSGHVEVGKTNRDCKFFVKLLDDDDEFNKQSEIRRRSNWCHGKSLLCPKILDKDSKGTSLVLGYSFKKLFEEWITDPGVHCPIFTQQDGIISKWWRKNIRDLLETFEMMHKSFVYHGDLSNRDSYVITHNGALCIIRPSIVYDSDNIDKATQEGATGAEKKDYVAFGKFCGGLETGFGSRDWDSFIGEFSHISDNSYNVQWIAMHPVLKSEEKRANYLEALVAGYGQGFNLSRDGRDDLLLYMDREETKKLYPNWKTRVQGEKYLKVLKDGGKVYKKDSIHTLIRYMDNVFKQIGKEMAIGYICRDLNLMFPGLLSDLHSTYVGFVSCSRFGDDALSFFPFMKSRQAQLISSSDDGESD